MGEAASRISKDAQSSAPEIPWENLIGMRNRLIHAYFDKAPNFLIYVTNQSNRFSNRKPETVNRKPDFIMSNVEN